MRRIQHNDYTANMKMYSYRDFSRIPDDTNKQLLSPPAIEDSKINIKQEKFPVKLYTMLSKEEYNDIITWMPHGRSWKVLKPDVFERDVMPLYFDYSNYHSFNRLINAWSFRRVSSGPDKGSYYHELFLRGMPHLFKHMRRLCKKEKKTPLNPKNEPDFRKLSLERPLPELGDEVRPLPLETDSSELQIKKGIPALENVADVSELKTKPPPSIKLENTSITETCSMKVYRAGMDKEIDQLRAHQVAKQRYAEELELLMLQHRRNRFYSRALFGALSTNIPTTYGSILADSSYVPFARNMNALELSQLYAQQAQQITLIDQCVSNMLPEEFQDRSSMEMMKGDFIGSKPYIAKSG